MVERDDCLERTLTTPRRATCSLAISKKTITVQISAFPLILRSWPQQSRVSYQGKYNTTDSMENDMMACWKVFEFFNQIPQEEQKDVAPCPKCFSTLTLKGEF